MRSHTPLIAAATLTGAILIGAFAPLPNFSEAPFTDPRSDRATPSEHTPAHSTGDASENVLTPAASPSSSLTLPPCVMPSPATLPCYLTEEGHPGDAPSGWIDASGVARPLPMP